MRQASYSEICRRVLEGFEAVAVDCTKYGFRKTLEEEAEKLCEEVVPFGPDE